MDGKFKGKEPEELFQAIFSKCQKLGISPSELAKLSSIRKLRSKSKCFWKQVLYWFLTAFVLLCAFVLSFGSEPVAAMLAKVWYHFRDYDIENEMCVLNMPPEMQNMFMPPVDCSMCRNLTEVERVTNISPHEFERRFAYSTVPVIVSDGTRNWTALKSFSFEFFQDLYFGDKEGVFWEVERECQFFPYQTEFQSLAEVLSMSHERALKPWYIGWSNCDTHIGNILRKHYKRPYFLPILSESTNIDWIFMGKPGYGAHMHIDHVDHPSWQAQIRGSKLWTLEPVPECYNECRTLETVVKAGEVIVLDTNRWYHKTLDNRR
ncbi:cupin_8 domain-containing protein [Caerostris darwini]|uniref:Cupin_8 domain-containing protein n=1 Tax=Caerostris darwini TaxID=1538125 RepID=A0AAV4QWG8_9ARAC|nr:cupin_8 domain-containing protein [Caerostris darwini]